MVDLGQKDVRNYERLFYFIPLKKARLQRQSGLIYKLESFYLFASNKRATSFQLITLKKASI